ncbi:MAG: hypothetical protein N2170_10065, partial [Bacteroidia bacterium]|nr:hypothetical protein [Bacteroidia bacterium]
GNHDWKAGFSGIQRQAQSIKHYPDVGQIGPDTARRGLWLFIFLDSEQCIRNPEKQLHLWRRIDTLLGDIQDSSFIVFCLHHPPRSAGSHGGHFHWSAHIFPLRIISPFLYLPLPGLGSLYVWLRKKVHHPTDVGHPGYRSMADSILTRAHSIPKPVFILSGHEHNLQAHRLEPGKWA